jgi:hypothetical protein
LLVAAAVASVIAGCASGSGQRNCGTLENCQAFALHHFGRRVLLPQGPAFTQGATERGVLGLEFRDAQAARDFSMFVGHSANRNVPCPGKVITTTVGRTFCFGTTKTALMVQFFDHGLLYTVTSDLPPGTQSPTVVDQDWMTRLVSGLA